jgi:hypothetical protein
MLEAKRNIRERYGTTQGWYSDFAGTNFYFFLLLLGFTLIPSEIFLKDVITSKLENPLII